MGPCVPRGVSASAQPARAGLTGCRPSVTSSKPKRGSPCAASSPLCRPTDICAGNETYCRFCVAAPDGPQTGRSGTVPGVAPRRGTRHRRPLPQGPRVAMRPHPYAHRCLGLLYWAGTWIWFALEATHDLAIHQVSIVGYRRLRRTRASAVRNGQWMPFGAALRASAHAGTCAGTASCVGLRGDRACHVRTLNSGLALWSQRPCRGVNANCTGQAVRSAGGNAR